MKRTIKRGDRGRRIFFILMSWAVAASTAALAQIAGMPVKISIQTESQRILTGQQMEFDCVLLDANNSPAKAAEDLQIQIQSLSASGKTNEVPITIKAGQSAYKFALPATEAGITKVEAKQKYLLNGETFIRVRNGAVRNRAPASEPVPSPPSTNAIEPFRFTPVINSERSRSGVEAAAPAEKLAVSNVLYVAAIAAESVTAGGMASAPLTSPGPSTSTGSGSPQEIGIILQQDSRKFLADGKDAANIFAFLDNKVADAPVDIELILFSAAGKLIPVPLRIPKGQDSAQAKLTSTEVGQVTVQYIRSKPPVNIEDGKVMAFSFGPPITKLALQPSPPRISLLESADLVVTLVNENGTAIATDEPRTVDLCITNGSGELEKDELLIAVKSASSHTRFFPTHHGMVIISAATPNLSPNTLVLSVTFPALLLGLSLFGGLIGGSIAASITPKRRKNKAGWVLRTLIGCATGFVFYYFGILDLISHIPRQVALNPFGTVFLSLIGGWSGTEVFAPILLKLGIGKGESAPGPKG